ncbi:MAG: hypothetical protein IKC31_01450 [Clostridia bacterium]|nr:hypothetical protein [Clostridia bacterium]
MSMNGLERITDKILEQAQTEANAILAKAEEECARIAKDAGERAERIKAQQYAQAEQEGSEIVTRAKSAAINQKRNLLLQTKSELVDDAFDQALNTLLGLSDEKYTELLAGLLTAAFWEQLEAERISRTVYGEEDAVTPNAYEVIFNLRDRARVGEAVLEATRKKLSGKVPAEKLAMLSLSKTTVSIDGGLILRVGDIESNCSLSLLLAQLREELELEVSRTLFDAPQGAF